MIDFVLTKTSPRVRYEARGEFKDNCVKLRISYYPEREVWVLMSLQNDEDLFYPVDDYDCLKDAIAAANRLFN